MSPQPAQTDQRRRSPRYRRRPDGDLAVDPAVPGRGGSDDRGRGSPCRSSPGEHDLREPCSAAARTWSTMVRVLNATSPGRHRISAQCDLHAARPRRLVFPFAAATGSATPARPGTSRGSCTRCRTPCNESPPRSSTALGVVNVADPRKQMVLDLEVQAAEEQPHHHPAPAGEVHRHLQLVDGPRRRHPVRVAGRPGELRLPDAVGQLEHRRHHGPRADAGEGGGNGNPTTTYHGLKIASAGTRQSARPKNTLPKRNGADPSPSGLRGSGLRPDLARG